MKNAMTQGRICLAVLLLCLAATLPAQISSLFTFAQSTANWQPIQGPYVTDCMTDEGLSESLSIGFSFPYGSGSFTELKISSNGWVNLGGNLTTPYWANDLATLNIRPLLAPLWDDLDMTNGAVQFSNSGVAPQRVFTVQWLNAKWVENYPGTNQFNFMVRLHENGQIDFIYGPHTGSPGGSVGASIGINIAPGGPGNFMSVTPGTGVVMAHINTTNQNGTVSAPIAEGVMYVFTPRSGQQHDMAAISLSGSLSPMQHVEQQYTATFSNVGLQNTPSDGSVVQLCTPYQVLVSTLVPSWAPGNYGNATFTWSPDSTGIHRIFARCISLGDTNAVNNESLALTLNVRPFVGNQDDTQPVILGSIRHYPSPFGSEGTFQYTLNKDADISIGVYDSKGRRVSTAVSAYQSAGSHAVRWNALDAQGQPLPAGVYYYTLSDGVSRITHKLVIIR